MDIAAWLRGLGLERYEAAFRDNEINWAVLPKLTADDLKDIGVTAVGHRRMLLEAIAHLSATDASPVHSTGSAGGSPLATLPRMRGRASRWGGGRAAAADRDVLRSGRLDAAVDAL